MLKMCRFLIDVESVNSDPAGAQLPPIVDLDELQGRSMPVRCDEVKPGSRSNGNSDQKRLPNDIFPSQVRRHACNIKIIAAKKLLTSYAE